MSRYDYAPAKSPKSRRGETGGILSAIRMVLACGIALLAAVYFAMELFPFLREVSEWLPNLLKGGPVEKKLTDQPILRSVENALMISLFASFISPIQAWRWGLRYLYGASFSVLVAGVLTALQLSGEVSELPLLSLIRWSALSGLVVLNWFRGLIWRKTTYINSSFERWIFRLFNWCILTVALGNLACIIGYVLYARLGILMELNRQRVNGLPSIQ